MRTGLAAVLISAGLPVLSSGAASVQAAGAPVTGSFFVDLDRDGAIDAGEDLDASDPLYPPGGITVTAYDVDGASAACVTTDATYSCDVAALAGTDFRLEFALDPADVTAGFAETFRGADSASSVQFASAGDSVTFGVTSPSMCPTTGAGFGGNANSPTGKVWTTCFVNGDRDHADGGSPQDVVVAVNFDVTGTVEKLGLKGDGDDSTDLDAELGSVWGMAYDEWNSTLFTAAGLRRHADVGSAGVAGVYWVTYPSGAWNAVDLSSVAGAPSYGALPARDIEGTTAFAPFYDNAMYGAIGRVGIGDIDLTPDGRTLMVTNLANLSLDVYDVSAAPSGADPTFVRSIPIADPGCSNADYTVWAIRAIDGDNALVGATCTGETSGAVADLSASVLPVDIAAGTVGAAELTIPLDYMKSCDATFAGNCAGVTYQPWTDTYPGGRQAILTDLELSLDGSLEIGILDRNSLQRTTDNYAPDPAETAAVLDYNASNGDLLHACNTSGDPANPTWLLEGAAGSDCDAFANFSTGGDFGTVQSHHGPAGAAEWYGEERLVNSTDDTEGHAETSQGGVYVNQYLDQVVTSSMDPINFESGGLEWFATSDGTEQNELELFRGIGSAGVVGKGTGIGDVEGCFLPIEIGDFVWLDLDRDGVQDGGETPLAGVTVMLLDSGGATVATTVTDATGNYTFDSSDGLLAETAYTLMFDVTTLTNTADLPAGVTAADLTETDLDSTVDSGTDANDSDVDAGKIAITTPAAGVNDHSFDAGYVAPVSEYRIGSLVWNDLDNDGTAEPGETPIGGVTVELLDAAGDVADTTTTDATTGEYVFEGLDAGDYSVRIPGGQAVLAGFSTSGTPTADADGGVDNDNNGVVDGASFTSGTVTLGDGTGDDEPTGEANGITGVDNEADAYPDSRSDQTIDFGFYVAPPMELGDQIWFDDDNSGIFEAGEPTAPAGVTVNLLDESGTFITSTTTEADGTYLFADLGPGKYIVEIPASELAAGGLLEGYSPSTGAGVSTDPEDDVEDNSDGALAAGGAIRSGVVMLVTDAEPTDDADPNGAITDANSNLTVDFGLVQEEEEEEIELSVGDTIWFDADNSGTLDDGEDTVPAGVVVELKDSNGAVIDTTTTDANGMYLFDGLDEGDYSVGIADENFATGGPLAGQISSTGNGATAPDPDDGTDDDDNGNQMGDGIMSDPVTLSPDGGLDDPTVDFGLIPAGSIGSIVFEDTNRNGQRDADETGIANVTINLLDEAGAVIATTTSAPDGSYLFDGLPPGKYVVEFVAPPGRTFTFGDVGDDGSDSDVDANTGRTNTIMLGIGEDITNVFAGVVPVVLPATGGNGVRNLLTIGGLLLAAGLVILSTGRRRKLGVL